MKIHIDTSKITGILTGSAVFENNFQDIWYYRNIELESGKIYGLISEYGQGCMYLSYLLGGNLNFEQLNVFLDDKRVCENDLKSISWNLEPSNETYKNQKVRKAIEKEIYKNGCEESFDDIATKFHLTEPRFDRKLKQLSGERWRASAALGYVSGKKIFYAPYKSSYFYYQFSKTGNLFTELRWLAEKGAIIVLPVGSDSFIKNVVDKCIYLDPKFN